MTRFSSHKALISKALNHITMEKIFPAVSLLLLSLFLLGCTLNIEIQNKTDKTQDKKTEETGEIQGKTTEETKTAETPDKTTEETKTKETEDTKTEENAAKTLIEWETYEDEKQGYSIDYPANWRVTEQEYYNNIIGIQIAPPDPEPFIDYIAILPETRTMDQIRKLYAEEVTYASESKIIFAGKSAYQYTYEAPSNRREIYIPHDGKVYLLSTGVYNMEEVQKAFSTFKFL